MKAAVLVSAAVLCLGFGIWLMTTRSEFEDQPSRTPAMPRDRLRSRSQSTGAAPAAGNREAVVEAFPAVAAVPEFSVQQPDETCRPDSLVDAVRRRFPQLHGRVRLPVVLEIGPEEVSGLSEQQIAAAIALAEQFQETMGGEAADGSTKEYLEKWRREQPLADYQLRAAIGASAYARWQEEAYLRGKAAAN